MKLAGLILIIFLLFFFGVNTTYETIENVEYFKVEKNTQNNIYRGIVKSKNSTNLSFQTQGQIIYLPYTKGDFVKKGSVIAKLDGTFYFIQKNEELAKMQEYVVLKNKQKRYYDRLDILHKEGAISDNDWESAYFELKTLDAQIKLQQEKIKYINKEIAFNSIVAPYDGYIADKFYDVGSYAQIAKPVIYFISSDGFQIEIMIDENVINKLKIGDIVKIQIQNIKTIGKISHISQTSVNSGGYLVKISIDVLENIKEGMSADVFLFEAESSIFVPIGAVFESNNDKFVYKIIKIKNNVGKTEKVKIKTGKIIDNKIEVLKGLKEGELIIKNFSLDLENRKIAL